MTGDSGELFRALADSDPDRRAAAAQRLLDSGAPLTGAPPGELLAALQTVSGPQLEPILNLARAWSRVEMSRAALDALPRARTPEQGEQLAWLLKTVLAAEHGSEAIRLVLDESLDAAARRWLLEGLERLVGAGQLGWQHLSGMIARLAGERHPTLRSGLASMLMTLPWRPQNTVLLEPLLLDPDHEVASAAAHVLAGHPDAVSELAPATLDHLRQHPNPMMRHAAAELDQALKSRET